MRNTRYGFLVLLSSLLMLTGCSRRDILDDYPVTSAVPILATTCLISGNLSINAFSAKRDTSILSVSELPAGSVICMAKSPSSKVGMNSASQQSPFGNRSH